jgi:hypothetical protein
MFTCPVVQLKAVAKIGIATAEVDKKPEGQIDGRITRE